MLLEEVTSDAAEIADSQRPLCAKQARVVTLRRQILDNLEEMMPRLRDVEEQLEQLRTGLFYLEHNVHQDVAYKMQLL